MQLLASAKHQYRILLSLLLLGGLSALTSCSMTPTTTTASSLPARGSHDQPARRPLAVLCLSGSLGGLELNSLKFARWMQERGWPVTFIGLPDAPLTALADEWAVPADV